MKNNRELPVAFTSEGNQLIGMLHEGQSKKLVILCHGFTGNKVEAKRIFVEAGRAFAAEGMSAFRFDFYGSGDSTGEFSDTLLSHNIANLNDAIEWGKEQGYEEFAVLGLSMGGATAILTLADTPAQAMVTWSAVPDLEKLFGSYVDNVHELAAQVDQHEHNGWIIKKEFWHDAIQYDIKKALAKITIPKFIVQGTADSPVFVQGFKDFQDIAMPPADFMEIPGGGHTYPSPQHRRQVIRQTLIWLKRHFL
ncbi:alpha/beta fold hydrolase [candidate division KSB1 bacterium]|nr:alpha/beta fold hydrolase [candidate division KSB1 bacterium]